MRGRTLTIGSLVVTVMDNGLIELRLTALRKGEPCSYLSHDQMKEIDAFLDQEDDDEDLEDVLG